MIKFNLGLNDKELKHAIGEAISGKRVSAKCQRMGGKFATIHCGTEYEIRPNGSVVFVREWMGCIANKAQQAEFLKNVAGEGFIDGRPTARKIAEAINNGTLILD